MSTETLKFFENRTTEDIINWMLENLSEDQIRMCLDQSGIPNTNLIETQEKATSDVPSPPPPPTQSPGAGSSTDPLPVPPPTQSSGAGSSTDPLPVPITDDSSGDLPDVSLLSINDDLLFKYREKCKGTQYIIKSVSNQGVEYYEFKEVEDEDDVISPGITIGDVGWIKKIVPVSDFDEFCTEQDLKDLEELKQDNMETFLGAPIEVKQVSSEYKSSGLEPPLPEIIPEVVPQDDIGELSNQMLKAIKIQQNSTDYIKDKFPNLYERGLKMFPVFVYGSEGDTVLFLKAQIEDGILTLEKGFVSVKLLNSKFRKILSDINSKIELGMYSPSENIIEELNTASKEFPEILPKIRKFYDKDYLAKFDNVNFGTLDDDESEYPDWLKDAEAQMNVNVVPPSSKCKKISDMTIPELESRARDKFGDQYVRDYKPVKYVNSLGFYNVKYVRRDCISEKPQDTPNSTPIIKEFQMDYGEDDDLLFD